MVHYRFETAAGASHGSIRQGKAHRNQATHCWDTMPHTPPHPSRECTQLKKVSSKQQKAVCNSPTRVTRCSTIVSTTNATVHNCPLPPGAACSIAAYNTQHHPRLLPVSSIATVGLSVLSVAQTVRLVCCQMLPGQPAAAVPQLNSGG